MTVDPNQVARFKNALAALSLEEIQNRLDRSQIIRPWKRRLAEDESARRESEARAILEQAQRSAAEAKQRRTDISRRVWVLVALAIFAVVTVIWTTLSR